MASAWTSSTPLVAAITPAEALVLLAQLRARLTGRFAGWSLCLGLLASDAIVVRARDGGEVVEELARVSALEIVRMLCMDELSFLVATAPLSA